jgi:L,D-transpeptidase ErfK/SrfK
MKKIIVSFFLLVCSNTLFAAVWELPTKGNDIVGHAQTATVQRGDNFPAIAQRYGVTYTGLVEANPGVDPQRPKTGTELTIPSTYILPNAPRQGIVINHAELRLYYYPPHQNVVYTYPVGIGVEGWLVPQGKMKIIQKEKNPTWYITPAVREELAKKGFNLPPSIGPGPDNPLGDYAMRLTDRTYLIHGVQDPTTVGRRSSSGCIRMYPDDIKALFSMVPLGTPVTIVNEPYKLGWQDGKLFLEAHLPLQEQQIADANDLTSLVNAINKTVGNVQAEIHWNHAFALARQAMGLPEQIGSRA